jgi:hypothetical protein
MGATAYVNARVVQALYFGGGKDKFVGEISEALINCNRAAKCPSARKTVCIYTTNKVNLLELRMKERCPC